ncbi:glycosyltransferase [Acetobacterium paludosum]|uniref:Glycosyltransferase n=1 Tax=Acetobacterium paludosum TaxID=52693 RepID=A0A923I6I7_9FIRM|nr:glycosyltransferase family 2 protein [Acetobacterium paludosum]MBC3889890.1 glycosyltransferase [Acetobacterium paludosum]
MKKHIFVICAYGKSRFLEECVDSILKQTAKENIIISTATPNELIEGVGKKYQIEIRTHDVSGIGIDWNSGYECADSKYVTLVHQDDVYKEDYQEKILMSMDKNEDSLIAFSNYREIRKDEIVSPNRNIKIKELMLSPLKHANRNRFIRRRILSLGNPICCPSVTYNKSLLNNFAFDMELNTNLDWAAWEKVSKYKGRFIYVSEPLMYHRIHEDSETSNTIENKKRAEEDLLLLKKFWPSPIANFIFHFYKSSEKSNVL